MCETIGQERSAALPERERALLKAAEHAAEWFRWWTTGKNAPLRNKVTILLELDQAIHSYEVAPIASPDAIAGDLAAEEVKRPEGTTPSISEAALIDGETA